MEIKKVTVLYNILNETKKLSDEDRLSFEDDLDSAKDASNALEKLGYEVTLFGVNNKSFKLLSNLKTDLIFNLTENFDDLPGSYCAFLSYLEGLDLPITGANSLASFITIDKARTKDFFVKNKIPTPNYQLFISSEDPLKYNLKFPLIAKPNTQDGSMGIDQNAVVTSISELRDRVAFLINTYKDAVLVEEYIEGRDLELLGVRIGENIETFPPMENIYIENDYNKWKMLDVNVKWSHGKMFREECPARIPKSVLEEMDFLYRKIVKIFGIDGNSRIDVRLTPDNKLSVLEINVNPMLSLLPGRDNQCYPEAKNVKYEEYIQMIVDSALENYKNKLQSSENKNKNFEKVLH